MNFVHMDKYDYSTFRVDILSLQLQCNGFNGLNFCLLPVMSEPV